MREQPPQTLCDQRPRRLGRGNFTLLLRAAKTFQGLPFTKEQLIVAAWRLWPEHFGLRGYEKLYPDSNVVLTCLYGQRGIAREELIHEGEFFRVKEGG